LITFLIFWWLSLLWTYHSAWPHPFDDWKNGLFYLGGGLLFGYQLLKNKTHFRLSLHGTTLSLFIYGFSILFSLWNGNALYEGLLEASRLFLWIGFAWSLSKLQESEWITLLKISVLSAAMISGFHGLQLRGIHFCENFFYSYNLNIAPVGYISDYGTFMAAHAPLVAFLLIKSRHYCAKILWVLCFILIFYGLWISATRASFAALFLAIFFGSALLVYRKIFSWKLLLVSFITMATIFVLFQKLQPIGLRQPVMYRLQTFVLAKDDVSQMSPDRWQGYLATLHMSRRYIFSGWGLGSFRFVFPEYDHRTGSHSSSARFLYIHPHNEVLHQLSEVGLIGLIAFLSFWILLFYKGCRLLKNPRMDPHTSLWIVLSMVGLIVYAVSCQFDANYLFPLSRLLIALFGGILWRKISPSPEALPEALKQIPLRRGPELLLIFVALTTLFLSAFQFSLYAVAKSKNAVNPPINSKEARFWAHSAFLFSPGAFDPLYTYAISELDQGNFDQAKEAMNFLYRQYPYVPLVLYQTARLRLQTKDVKEARSLLQHALSNDPDFEDAKKLLASIH